MKAIKLTKENYKSYLPISMVAFSYNQSMADDLKGHLFVIDDKGISFEIDNRGSELSSSEILDICPFIETISITPKRVVAPEGWKVVDLDNEILAINVSIYKRFIRKNSVTPNGELAEKSLYSINEDLISEEEQFDGFYAIATNLEDSPEDIIRINHRRWEIEECFRIMKHEFSARPVYVRNDLRISAHFTTCFLALLLFRYLEKLVGHSYTCDDIIKNLRQIRFLKLEDAGFLPAYTRNSFTDDLHSKICFRTDFEIISKASMRNIISKTKDKA